MRKTSLRLSHAKLTAHLAASVALAAVSVTYATPVYAQAPHVMRGAGPIGLNQRQCIDVAKLVIAALGGSEIQGDEKTLSMERGHFNTVMMCDVPGRLIVVVAGPNGNDPEPELDAVLAAFVERAGSSPPTGAKVKMPALPQSIAEARKISQPINRTFIVGRWTDNGNCGNSVVFKNDNTFTSGATTGRWTLQGETLTFLAGNTAKMIVRGVGKDRILLVYPDGRLAQSVRCP